MSNMEYTTRSPDGDEPLVTSLGITVPKDSAAVRIVDGQVVGFYYDPAVAEYLRARESEIEARLAAMSEEEKEELRNRVYKTGSTYFEDGSIEDRYSDGKVEIRQHEA